VIDEQERRRAAAFRFERDRRHFIVRRGRLRMILGELVGEAPARLGFVAGTHGKPALSAGAPCFSASQSGSLMMLAIATVEVGCDIERIDPDIEWLPIADLLFAPVEREALRRMPHRDARRAFFDCWTRKEAYVKALGLGLSYPLDAFTVSVDREARMSAEEGWAITDAAPGGGYAGAVVAKAGSIHIEVRSSI
jgi:4'-phosphopantetheinyl transferase